MPDNLTDHDIRLRQAKEDEKPPWGAKTWDELEQAFQGFLDEIRWRMWLAGSERERAIREVLEIVEGEKYSTRNCVSCDYDSLRTKIEALNES